MNSHPLTNRSGRKPAVLLATLLCLGLGFSPGRAEAKSKTPAPSGVKIMVYEGKLQNSEGRAISGIFPLTFELHRRARGGRAVWSETHYVAVDEGSYAVELGRVSMIRGSIDLSSIYLGVKLGDAELFREKVDQATVRDAQPALAPPVKTKPGTGAVAPAPTAGTPVGVRKQDGKSVVDYAEEAGQAYVAGQAKVAERIGTLTAKEIEDAVKKLKQSKGGGGTLGTTKKYTKLVGGTRGVEYTLMCPKGHVVTGVTGGAGLYVDSIKLICQPLE